MTRTALEAMLMEHLDPIVKQRDFKRFATLASTLSDLSAGDEREQQASLIETLLRSVLTELSATAPAAIPAALDTYAACVLPARRQLGLGDGDFDAIRDEHRTVADTIPELVGAADVAVPLTSSSAAPTVSVDPPPVRAQPTPAQPEPTDSTAKATGRDEADPNTADATDGSSSTLDSEEAAPTVPSAAIDYDEVVEMLVNRSPHRRTVVLFGFSTSGKSFFLQRLEAMHKENYTVSQRNHLSDGSPVIDRTKDVLHYIWNHIKADHALDIFDVPGEQFMNYAMNFATMRPDFRESFSAILSAADAIVFIEPAILTLAVDTFKRDGDIVSAARSEIDDRVLQHGRFINALGILARRLNRLIGSGDRSHLSSAEALRSHVETANAIEHADLVNERSKRVPLPALLLLSRADDYQRRVACAGTFDQDPMRALLFDKPRVTHFAQLFESFSVDFITADAMKTQRINFDEASPHAGFVDFLDGWLLPAIRDSRQPRWRKKLRMRLRHPSAALRMRRLISGSFRRRWNDWRKEGPHG